MQDPTHTVAERLGLEAESDVRALGVSRGRAWTLALLAMLALAATLVDRQALAALAVSVTADLGISNVAYGWLSSAFAGAYLIGTLPAARLIQRIGPRLGLVTSVALTSLAIALHGMAGGFVALLALRVVLGLAVAPAFGCAAQAIHFVLPFKDRARGIGMLYMGNSIGSALCPPLMIMFASVWGWRAAFAWAAVIGVAWIPVWVFTSFASSARMTLDSLRLPVPWDAGMRPRRVSAGTPLADVLRNPASLRAMLVVATSAPITTVMLIWGAKYLVSDHGLTERQVGHYLWLPPVIFGSSSLLFGEFRARSARTRARTRPPRLLMSVAALLAVSFAAVPLAHGPRLCVFIASLAMAGSGGLYTLATSDMLVHARAGTIPVATGLTTLTQSIVYIIVSPLIGAIVQHFGNYQWVMVGAGLGILPGYAYWFAHASERSGPSLSPT
jgi:ACS family hexuronate transporter-like MFS transporter